MKYKRTLYLGYTAFTFIVISVVLFIVTSRLIAYFQTPEELPIELAIDNSINNFYAPRYIWENLDNQGRAIEEHTLNKITDDYLASYYYNDLYNHSDKDIGLKDYYTKKSRAKAILFKAEIASQNSLVRSTTIDHVLNLKLYSEDGTVIVLEDEQVSYTRIYEQNQLLISFYDTARFDVMLLMEDNFWRIRHKIRHAVNNSQLPKNLQIDTISTVTVKNNKFMVGGKPFISKGMNYYPASFPWNDFWTNFDTNLVQQDFKIINDLHLNTVRIFIPYEQFGAHKVKVEYLTKLHDLLDQAEAHDLKVIVTLFDFFLSYEIDQWTKADRHVEAIIKGVGNHPAIFSWDVKNEPDLDFNSQGEVEVNEWLKFITQRLKAYAPRHLVTIGWSSPDYLTNLAESVDYYSFHYYKLPQQLNSYIKAPFEKPVLLEETGQHTYNSWWYPFRQSEEDQDKYLKEIFEIIEMHQISFALWTLHDFKSIPDNVVGKVYWRKGIQKNFGLINRRNKPKPAYSTVKSFNKSYFPSN